MKRKAEEMVEDEDDDYVTSKKKNKKVLKITIGTFSFALFFTNGLARAHTT